MSVPRTRAGFRHNLFYSFILSSVVYVFSFSFSICIFYVFVFSYFMARSSSLTSSPSGSLNIRLLSLLRVRSPNRRPRLCLRSVMNSVRRLSTVDTTQRPACDHFNLLCPSHRSLARPTGSCCVLRLVFTSFYILLLPTCVLSLLTTSYYALARTIMSCAILLLLAVS